MAAKDTSDVYGRILSALYGDYQTGFVSATDLVCLIIGKCSGLFHPRLDEVDDKLDYFNVFAVAIGELASKQTKLANSLWEHSAKLKEQLDHKDKLFGQSLGGMISPSGDRASTSKVEYLIEEEMRALSDITGETKCLKEIKDILDELNSILYIFGQQIAVVETMVDDVKEQSHNQDKRPNAAVGSRQGTNPETKGQNDPSSAEGSHLPNDRPNNSAEDTSKDMKLKYKQVLKMLRRRNNDIENLKAKAYKIYKDLCDLLDLKQKQATVSEALYARQGAKETSKQGQTILLFTIVTIIFLPLSFIATIFSMSAHEINPDSDRPIRQIFSIMFPTTAAILVISLLLAYNSFVKRLIVMASTPRRNQRVDVPETLATPPPAPALDSPNNDEQPQQPLEQANVTGRRTSIHPRSREAASPEAESSAKEEKDPANMV